MIPAPPPANAYTVTVMCGDAPCTFPIRAQVFPGGGSPTPIPPSFTSIRLRIEPAPPVMPHITWHSRDERIVIARFTNPMEAIHTLPSDTAATPPPDELRTLLVPASTAPQRLGDASGSTTVDAEIGAPVNERISIPVYSAGLHDWTPPLTARMTYSTVTKLRPAPPPGAVRARIDYDDPITSTYGTPSTLFTEVPWAPGTGGFFQAFGSVRVAYSPMPFSTPDVTWSIDGASATITPSGVLRGIAPGTSVVHARIAAPQNQDISIPIVTYPTLVLPCNHGVRFSPNGSLQFTTDADTSDLYLTCSQLNVPGGGVMLTNGDDRQRAVARGAIRGPQFPDLTAALWQDAFTVLDGARYDAAIEPCNVPESPGISRVQWNCATMPARTLLFRTRGGRYVKWLMQIGNGFNVLAGPYQVL